MNVCCHFANLTYVYATCNPSPFLENAESNATVSAIAKLIRESGVIIRLIERFAYRHVSRKVIRRNFVSKVPRRALFLIF